MSIGFIGFLTFVFMGLTWLNRMLEGAFVNATDISIVNQLLVWRPMNVFGLFSISVPNLEFLTDGLPHLIAWDYSYFGGNNGIILYFLYSFSAAMAFGLFVLMLGLLYNYFSRSR